MPKLLLLLLRLQLLLLLVPFVLAFLQLLPLLLPLLRWSEMGRSVAALHGNRHIVVVHQLACTVQGGAGRGGQQ